MPPRQDRFALSMFSQLRVFVLLCALLVLRASPAEVCQHGARRRFQCAGGAEPLYSLPFFGIKRDLNTKAVQQTKGNKEHLSHAPREYESACKQRRERFLILSIARELN
jgi:hypothetical protein